MERFPRNGTSKCSIDQAGPPKHPLKLAAAGQVHHGSPTFSSAVDTVSVYLPQRRSVNPTCHRLSRSDHTIVPVPPANKSPNTTHRAHLSASEQHTTISLVSALLRNQFPVRFPEFPTHVKLKHNFRSSPESFFGRQTLATQRFEAPDWLKHTTSEFTELTRELP